MIDILLDENADFVIRRRIPRILAEIDDPRADRALLEALAAGRFEVRYRAAIALARRRKAGLATAPGVTKPAQSKRGCVRQAALDKSCHPEGCPDSR